MRTLYFVTVLLVTIALTSCKKKSAGLFSASIVEDLVRNEVQKKMPSAAHTKTMTGVHLKEATDAINKLVDESIVDRVHEAEKEVSRMLLKSIEHHIQDAGKALLKTDEDTCKDRIEGCKELASSNVCETSKDAMIVNCPHTCNFCGTFCTSESTLDCRANKGPSVGMLSELKDQSKQQSQTQSEEPERKPKRKHKKRKHRRHKSARLTASEANMVHQSMLDQAIDNSNLPNAVASENQESVPQATTQAAQQAAPEDTQAQDAADAAAQQQEAEEAQKEQDEAELRKQQEEEEARKQEELEEEERQAEERRRKHRRRKKLLKQHQEQAALATPEKGKKRTKPTRPMTADMNKKREKTTTTDDQTVDVLTTNNEAAKREKTTINEDTSQTAESGSGSGSGSGETEEKDEKLDDAAEYTTTNVASAFSTPDDLDGEPETKQTITNAKPLTKTENRQTNKITSKNKKQASIRPSVVYTKTNPKTAYAGQLLKDKPKAATKPIAAYHQAAPVYQPVATYQQPIAPYQQPVALYRQPVANYRHPLTYYRQPVPSNNRRIGTSFRQPLAYYQKAVTQQRPKAIPSKFINKPKTSLQVKSKTKHSKKHKKHFKAKNLHKKLKTKNNTTRKSLIKTSEQASDIVDDVLDNMTL